MNTLDPFYFPYATENFREWAPSIFKNIFGLIPDVIQEDILYKDVELNGDKVLLIGGGPSTNSLKPEDCEIYTDIISMNRCYHNPVIRGIKLTMLGVGGIVDLNDVRFLEYARKTKSDTQLLFEIHPKWYNVRLPACGFYHTKMYGQIGMGVRLINLAAALGAEQIDFIGLDGPGAILQGKHAFEPGKTELPSMCNQFNADQVHTEQYKFFWSYIRELYPHTKINSLDKTNKYHRILL